MNKVLGVLIGIVFILLASFGAASGIVESWVLFFEYGWIYNEVTVPPLVLWHIFFTNMPMILILTAIITPIASAMIIYIYTRM